MSTRDALIEKIQKQPDWVLKKMDLYLDFLAKDHAFESRTSEPAPPPAKVRFEKENGFTVGVTDQPIDEEALKKALDEFP